jgi:hypothetical protein
MAKLELFAVEVNPGQECKKGKEMARVRAIAYNRGLISRQKTKGGNFRG